MIKCVIQQSSKCKAGKKFVNSKNSFLKFRFFKFKNVPFPAPFSLLLTFQSSVFSLTVFEPQYIWCWKQQLCQMSQRSYLTTFQSIFCSSPSPQRFFDCEQISLQDCFIKFIFGIQGLAFSFE